MSQKRGAPPGNKNALKHGFYAHAFTASEKSELSYDVNGQLTGEIKLLKTLINRTAEKVNHPDSEPMTFQENLSTLHIISMAISRLESLYRSNELLYSHSDSDLRELFKSIGCTDEEIDAEIHGLPPPGKNRPGGQVGNTNALKHGFYASVFKPSEIRRLAKYDPCWINDEIALLRVLIKRTAASMPEKGSLQIYLKAISVITFAVSVIEKLQRTNRLMFGKETRLEKIFQEALDSVQKELGIQKYFDE